MNNHKFLLVIFFFLSAIFNGFSQQQDEVNVRDLPLRERFFVGGNLGLQISNINTSVVVSPRGGFRFTNRFTAGLGLTYQFYRDRGWGALSGYTATTHIYGGGFFARYGITRSIFAQAEYEALNLDAQMGWALERGTTGRFWEQNYFLGGGYRTPLGPRAYLNAMLLYNFNTESVVYFQNPVFRLGVDVSL